MRNENQAAKDNPIAVRTGMSLQETQEALSKCWSELLDIVKKQKFHSFVIVADERNAEELEPKN